MRCQHPSSGEHIEISFLSEISILSDEHIEISFLSKFPFFLKHFLILLEAACSSTTLAEVRGIGVD